MINGGPAANYYAGPGDGSEYSTTVINCLFEFVKIECTEAYKIYFEVLKMLCFTFLGLPPLVPSIVGSDRAKAIVNAALFLKCHGLVSEPSPVSPRVRFAKLIER